LKDIKVRFDLGFIPFGWDYGCDILCTHSFSSMNDESTAKITKFFKDKMDRTNPDNNIGAFLNGPPKTDTLGLL